MNDQEPSPAETLPDSVTSVLEESSDARLRTIVRYARQLLGERRRSPTDIEPRDGEEIVKITEHDAYTIVIVERTEEKDGSGNGGRFAYRVEPDPTAEDDDDRFIWYYVGRVFDGHDG